MRILTLVALLIVPLAAQQPSPRELFERARLLEESNRGLDEAIALYTQAAAQASQKSERELAATAQLRAGLLYERLGRNAEAERAFKIVGSQYADQTDVAREAQARLAPAARATSEPAVRRVWANGCADLLGSPSADGKYLSVVDWTTGDLAVCDLRTAETRRLTNKGAWTESEEHAEASTFSPDGTQVAYAWFNSDRAYDLRVIRIDGRQPRVVYRNDEVAYLFPSQWSPDGRSILVLVTLKSGSNQIAIVSVADGSVRVLKSIGWSGPVKLGVSADGRFVAYHAPVREESPNRDIFILASDGSRESSAVEHPADDVLLGWAPDGRHILFASDRTGTMSAWRLPVADGRPQGPAEIVKRDFGRVWPLGFASSGAYFYGLESGVLDVLIYPFDSDTGRITSTPPSKLTQRFVAMNLSPEFSPNGQRVLYVSKRTAGPPFFQQVITIQSLQTGEVQDLTTELGYVGRVRWSPDGHSLLAVGRDRKNRQGIYRIDPRTGAATTLVQGEPDSQVGAPGWSTDEKTLFFLRVDSKDKLARIVRLETDTGQETAIYRTETPRLAQRMAVSPDARHVAFIESDSATRSSLLKVIPAAGGDARTLVNVQAPEAIVTGYDILAWSPDGRYVFFARSSAPGRHALWRVALAGGASEPLELETAGIYGVAVHPSGTRLAVARGELSGEIWVMENFLPAIPSPLPAARR